MISRRGFLVGTLTAAAGAAGAAVLQATPEEVKAFGKPLLGPVTLAQPDPIGAGSSVVGELVFDRRGQPVGFVTYMEVSNDMVDVTMRDDSYRSFMPSGPLRVTYRVDGTGYKPMRLG